MLRTQMKRTSTRGRQGGTIAPRGRTGHKPKAHSCLPGTRSWDSPATQPETDLHRGQGLASPLSKGGDKDGQRGRSFPWHSSAARPFSSAVLRGGVLGQAGFRQRHEPRLAGEHSANALSEVRRLHRRRRPPKTRAIARRAPLSACSQHGCRTTRTHGIGRSTRSRWSA